MNVRADESSGTHNFATPGLGGYQIEGDGGVTGKKTRMSELYRKLKIAQADGLGFHDWTPASFQLQAANEQETLRWKLIRIPKLEI